MQNLHWNNFSIFTILETPAVKRRNEDHDYVAPQTVKRRPLVDIANIPKTPIPQNQMTIFNDKNFVENFFCDWNQTQQKTIENNQMLLGREQNLRRQDQELRLREQDLRGKDQDLLKTLVNQLCASNDRLLCQLDKPSTG